MGTREYWKYVDRMKKQVTEGLKKSNKVKLGEGYFVRIPEIKGRISRTNKNGTTYVEFIYERGYDPETGQSRNKKAVIGQIFTDLYPDALLPNNNYDEYFDIDTGELKPPWNEEERNEKENENQTTAGASEEERESKDLLQEDTNSQLTPGERARALRARGIAVPWSPEEMTEEEKKQHKDMMRRAGREIYESIVAIRTHDAEQKDEEEKRKRNLELYGEEEPNRVAPLSLKELHKIFVEDGLGGKDDNDEETTEEDDTESENGMENTFNEAELQESYDAIEAYHERIAILANILKKIHESIKTQAKRHPDQIINAFKAMKINSILQELKEKYKGTGYDDLLELIEEPREVEADGETVLVGPTYSDVEILLDSYDSILHFIKAKMPKQKK